MTNWCHNICLKCWKRKNSTQRLLRVKDAPRSFCCFCLRANNDGILVRWKGTLLKCEGKCA